MSIKKSDKVLKNNQRALCVGEMFDILNADTDDEIDVVITILPEMFDGLTDEEDIDDKQLYGDEGLEIDITGTFKIQAKNDCKGARNMECIGNIRRSKCLACDTPSTSTFNHNLYICTRFNHVADQVTTATKVLDWALPSFSK